MAPRVLLVGLLAQACGGVASILTKLALGGLGPWSVVAARLILGFALLALVRGGASGAQPRQRFTPRDVALLLLLSWGGFALPQLLIAQGIELSTGTAGALLSPLEPIGILLGGMIVLRERLTAVRAFAVVSGTLGAIAIVLQGNLRPELSNPRGDLLIALGHLAWAIYTLAAKPLLERHDAMRITRASILLSLPPTLALAAGEPFAPERALPALGWVLLLALVSTALGTWAWNQALRQMSAGAMATLIFAQPVVGLAAGRFALGEPVGPLALSGAALILAGVVLEARRGGG